MLTTFQNTYKQGTDDHVNDFAQCPDGGYIMAGESIGGNSIGSTDAVIVKTDAKGNFLWNKRIGGTSGNAFYRIRNTSDGGYIATGYTTSFGNSNGEIYLVKLTGNGNVSWSAVFGTNDPHGSYGSDVVETADGGFAVAGSNGSNYDTTVIVVIKTTATGNVQWSKKFFANKIARETGLTVTGNTLFVSGYTSADFNTPADGVLIKLDAISGAHYFTKSYDKAGMDDQILSIDYSQNSLVMAFGHNDNITYPFEKSILKTDLNGNVLLSKQVISPQKNNINRFLAPVADGGFIAVLGYTNDYNPNAELARFDASGKTIFARKFSKPGWQLMKCVMQLNDGTFATAGDYSIQPNILDKSELIKTDANGETGDCTADSLVISTTNESLKAANFSWLAIQDNAYTATQFVTPVIKQDNVTQNQFCRNIPCDSVALTPCLEIFEKLYGGSGDDIALDTHTTTDKGYIVTGETTSGTSGTTDGFIMKLGKSGSVNWSKIIGGNNKDVLSKVIETTDGFIAIGTTASFGNTKGETFLVNMHSDGTIHWARHYSAGGINGEKGKNVIQLSDGGYAFVSNINDSSAAGDGLVVRTDALGNVLWSIRFDNGGDDGFNTLIQTGSTLLVGGYASNAHRYTVLMKLNVADGSMISSTTYVNYLYENGEMINIEKINNGIAYTSRSSYSFDGGGTYNTFLSHFKERNDGTMFYQRRAAVELWNKTSGLSAVASADSGFIYAACDTTTTGFAELDKVGPTGLSEWRRSNYDYGYYLLSLDRIGSTGYVCAGYANSYNTSGKSKILLLATDLTGRNGECTPGIGQDFMDTAHYTITPFSWQNIIQDAVAVSSAIYPRVIIANFSGNTVCGATVCDSIPPIADSCTSGTAIKYSTNYIDLLTGITKAADSSYYMCGIHYYYSTEEPLIVKAKPNGDIAWAKSYNQFIHTGTLQKIVNTVDGGFLVGGLSAIDLNHQSADSSFLMKIDKNGNIVWAKNLNSAYISNINDIIPSDNGGFFIVTTENWLSGGMYTLVARIDGNGNFLWKKKLVWSGSSPVFRSITFDGKNLYLASDDYTGNGLLMIVKMDAISGTYAWSKDYLISNQQLVVRSVQTIADSVFVFYIDNQQLTPFPTTANLAMMKLNAKDGTILNSLIFTNPAFSNEYIYGSVYDYHLPNELVKTNDNNFIFGNQVTDNNGKSLNMLCFNGSGVVQWQRNYRNITSSGIFSIKQFDNELLLVTENNVGNFDNLSPYTGGLIKTDLLGNIKLAAAPSSACYSTLVNTASTQPLVFTEAASRLTGVEDFSEFQSINVNPYVRVLSFEASQECDEVSNCKQLDITGMDSVCNTSDTLTYNIIRSPGCTAGALWEVDSTMAKTIAVTDTSLKLIFKKTGGTNIVARMNSGCIVITKSFPVQVIISPDTLNLGPDKAICGSLAILLNAHKGFKSYLWQDGSTDSTFDVTLPGTYYVKATTFCNSVLQDTINIVAGISLPLHIGNDTAICRGDSVTLRGNAGFISYNWSPAYNINNTTGNSVIVWPFADTIYKVAATQSNGCVVVDSIRISLYNLPHIVIGNDTSICAGTQLQLDAGPGFINYLWNTGSNAQQLLVSTAGAYNVTVTDTNGCKARDTLNIISVFVPPALNLGSDTSICSGEALHLTAGSGFSTYLWNTGATSESVDVNKTGTFWVDAVDGHHCRASDTISILSILPKMPVNLGNDTLLCEGQNVLLNAGPGFVSYQWNTGETSQTIYASAQGIYFVAAKNSNNCISTDTFSIIKVNAVPTINLDKDSSLCAGASRVLDAGPGTSYLWQDGSTGRTYTTSGPGQYWVTVTNSNNCTNSDTTAIKSILPLPLDFVIHDTAVCEAESLVLRSNQSFKEYLWSTGSISPAGTITVPGTYWLQVTDNNGCTSKEYINVAPKQCVTAIYFPNAFTPNNDGLNDNYKAKVYGIVLKYHLAIYNRFGQKVFETYDASKAWDGSFNNINQDPGTFTWYSEYQLKNDVPKTQKGIVTLIR